MKKVIGLMCIFIYLIITALLTYCLLSYNDYNFSEIGDKTIYVIKEDNENYKKYDLLFIEKTNDYKVGDRAFYYFEDTKTVNIEFDTIKEIDTLDEKTHTYIFENDNKTSDEYILGNTKSTISYGKLGFFYSILISKWGYLLLIVFPMLIMFIFEIYKIIVELVKK